MVLTRSTQEMGGGFSQTAQDDPSLQDALQKITEAFDAYDTNRDGTLSKEEFLVIVNDNLTDANVTSNEREDWFDALDSNGDGVIDKKEFMLWWSGDQRRGSSFSRLDAVRTNLANKRGIFLGFTYSEFKRSKSLDPLQVRTWAPNDVMLYLASRPELGVLRSELDRDIWKDIDGETLLELEAADLVQKRIKKYHVKKIMRVIEALRAADMGGGGGGGAEEGANSSAYNMSRDDKMKTVGRPPRLDQLDNNNNGLNPSNLRTRTTSLHQEENASPMPSPRKIRRQGSTSGEVHFDWKKSDLLGQGAFGQVFLGLDNESGALLAVKECHFTIDNAADVQELKLEITLLRKLDHKHIVRYVSLFLLFLFLFLFSSSLVCCLFLFFFDLILSEKQNLSTLLFFFHLLLSRSCSCSCSCSCCSSAWC